MPPKLALLGCTFFVFALLIIERRYNPKAKLSLWLPTIWILIAGSRPVVLWFHHSRSALTSQAEAGSSIDRIILTSLVVLSFMAIMRRGIDWSIIVRDNKALIVIYLYLAFSIIWSDLPFVSLKRWIRLFYLFPIAVVILCQPRPFDALISIYRRCAYILIPFSIVLIKYYPHLGVQYGRFTGQLMWIGVSGQKNGLGMICALSIFVLLWHGYSRYKSGKLKKLTTRDITDTLIILIALYLLRGPGGAYSATSISVLIVATTFMFIFFHKNNILISISSHVRILLFIVPLIYFIFSSTFLPIILETLGRDPTITGRAEIWRLTREIAANNPIFGVGYGSFWGLENEYTKILGVEQAHNGYLGVYLEVGIVGLLCIFYLMAELGNKVDRQRKISIEKTIFGICFLIIVLMWNYSEDTFFKPSLLWSSLTLVYIVYTSQQLKKPIGFIKKKEKS